MSKRLQVVMDETEMRAVTRDAKRNGMTVSQWVRHVLKAARREVPSGDPARKLAAIRAAASNDFPTADIDQMLGEIETGYAG